MIGTGTNDPNDPDDIRYGRIPNPTVHIALNQFRRVMNALIAEYGKPAQVVLESLVDQREKSVVGLTSAGQVREFQLRLRFRFRLRTREGKVLIDNAEILQQRDVSFSETTALASEAQEQLLYRDMQSDIVQQVLRRLAAVQVL